MDMKKAIEKTEILIEALPYIKKFHDKFIIIKYGGSALVSKKKRLRYKIIMDKRDQSSQKMKTLGINVYIYINLNNHV